MVEGIADDPGPESTPSGEEPVSERDQGVLGEFPGRANTSTMKRAKGTTIAMGSCWQVQGADAFAGPTCGGATRAPSALLGGGRQCRLQAMLVSAGASAAMGTDWFRDAGGIPTSSLRPGAGRNLSFLEPAQIAVCRAWGYGGAKDRPIPGSLALDPLAGSCAATRRAQAGLVCIGC